MDKTKNVIDFLREVFSQKAHDAWVDFTDTAALNSAAMLIEDTQIDNPVEQVKYLYDRHYSESFENPMLMNIPWAWLFYCLEKGLIGVLPREDWLMNLFLKRAEFIRLPTTDIFRLVSTWY